MRPILFKAIKDKLDDDSNSNIWVQGSLILLLKTTRIIYLELQEPDGDMVEINYEVKPNTVCQFIGLKDKNKTNVFECDEINHHIFGEGVVVWDEVMCSFVIEWADGCKAIIYNVCGAEVTGNIHDPKKPKIEEEDITCNSCFYDIMNTDKYCVDCVDFSKYI